MKIHLDTDLGGDPDDLCALAMLLAWPGVEITGITTVAEVDGRRAGYTKYALALAGRGDILVAAGADATGGHYREPVELPDEASYWPEPIAPAPAGVADALALLGQSIAAGATVVAIGPFTNLALFDQAHPGVLAETPLFLMGGHVHAVPPGFPEWESDTDFNVQFDIPSAHHVLRHCRPTLIPIEVTAQTALRRAYLPALRRAGSLGPLLARQADTEDRIARNAERYGRTCAELPDDILNFQHDPLACAVALGWDGVTIAETPLALQIRDGHLHTAPDPAGRPLPVVTAVDGDRFNSFWRDLVCA